MKWYEADVARGMLVAAMGSEAVNGVPKYMMLEVDVIRAMDQRPGGGIYGGQ